MLTNILIWAVIGILGGLIAYFIYPTKKEAIPGMLAAGMAGAFVGGVFYSIVRIGDIAYEIDPVASVMAVLSAVLILRIVLKTAPVEEEFLDDRSNGLNLP